LYFYIRRGLATTVCERSVLRTRGEPWSNIQKCPHLENRRVRVSDPLISAETGDPFEDSVAAVDAFEASDWLRLLEHNLADIQRTRELAESADGDAGDDRELVGPDGILAAPERFGYGRADDGGGDADV
jgi:hypothetical protein